MTRYFLTRHRLAALVVLCVAAVAAAAAGTFAWSASSQEEPPVNVSPQITPQGLVRVNGDPISGELVAIFEANGMRHAEAINAAIEQVLMRQAAERIGVVATEEEGKEYVRDLEASWEDLDEEQLREVEALLIAQGLPTSNLAEDPRMVEFGQAAKTSANVLGFLRERLAVAELTGVEPETIANAQELASAKEGLEDQAIRDAISQMVADSRAQDEIERFIEEQRTEAEIVPVGESE